MKKRLIGGAIIAAILIPVLYFGGPVFYTAIGLLGAVAFKELVDVRKDSDIPALMKIVGLIAMLMLTFVNVGGYNFIFGLSYQTLSLVIT